MSFPTTSIAMKKTLISLITPAFNEAQNLPRLYGRICAALDPLADVAWEWIVVDDHSADDTFPVVAEIATRDPRVRGMRLSRNAGSHIALRLGLSKMNGDCAVALVGDLQDPPEIIAEMLEVWRGGTQVVWAVRESRKGEDAAKILFSRFYYWIMRRIVGLKDLPSMGADFFLADRRVINVLTEFNESNVSILALLTWVGFRQGRICYEKQARAGGESGWTFEKKVKIAIDSVTSFSYFPIRLMSYAGMAVALSGFLYTLVIVANKFLGNPSKGWSELMIVLLILGGLQMLMTGVLGEYVWRTLDESRRRPRFMVENDTRPG